MKNIDVSRYLLAAEILAPSVETELAASLGMGQTGRIFIARLRLAQDGGAKPSEAAHALLGTAPPPGTCYARIALHGPDQSDLDAPQNLSPPPQAPPARLKIAWLRPDHSLRSAHAASLCSALPSLPALLLSLTACTYHREPDDLRGQDVRLVMVHTSDVHSRLQPISTRRTRRIARWSAGPYRVSAAATESAAPTSVATASKTATAPPSHRIRRWPRPYGDCGQARARASPTLAAPRLGRHVPRCAGLQRL